LGCKSPLVLILFPLLPSPSSPLTPVGVEAEADKVNKLISELQGKNLEEIMAEGRKKLQAVPSGVAVAAPAAGGAAPAAGGAPAAAKKPEPESEEEEDMGFSLFD
jgi:large subunit ribosomal protein LP2